MFISRLLCADKYQQSINKQSPHLKIPSRLETFFNCTRYLLRRVCNGGRSRLKVERIMDERRLLPFIYNNLTYFPSGTSGYRYPHPKTFVTKSPQQTTRNDINEVMLRESILGLTKNTYLWSSSLCQNPFVQQPE